MKINFNDIKNSALKYAEKYMPTVLIVGGIVGVAYSAFKAAEVTPEAKEVVEEFKADREAIDEKDISEEEKRGEVVEVYKATGMELVKLYAKPIVVGTFSVAMIFVSHGMLTKQVATLTTACASLDTMYKNYRKNVIDKYGEEEDFRLRNNIKTVEVEETETTEKGRKKKVKKELEIIENLPEMSMFSRLFDESNPNWKKDPSLNKMFLTEEMKYVNKILPARGYLLLNDVLDLLGYQTCREGTVYGWIWDPNGVDYQIDFGMRDIHKPSVQNFINGYEPTVMLDFNCSLVYNDLPKFAAI